MISRSFLPWQLPLVLALTVLLSARAEVVISEFVASNTRGVVDEDGDFSDWIELHNSGPDAVELDNWFLTDDASRLTQWRFPSTNMPPGGRLLVFASSKDRRKAGVPLHTNFKLSASGEYLGLVRPDGVTVASAFSPAYPAQVNDVSYGLDTGLRSVVLLSTNSVGAFSVPTDASLGSTWRMPGFSTEGWRSVTGAVGFSEVPLDRLQPPGLLSGMAGYWKLDENTGTNFLDSSGLANNGVLLGYPTTLPPWTNGLSGRSLRLRGATYRAVGRVADYPKASNALSVAAWVFADGRGLWASIAKNWSSSGGQFHFGLRDTAGDLDLSVRTSAGVFTVREGLPITTGVWQHVAFTADGSTLNLFRNGVLVARTNYQGTFVQGSAPALGIGARLNDSALSTDSAAPGQWSGRIDELAVWNRALTEEELIAIAQAGNGFGGRVQSDVKADAYLKGSAAYLRLPFVVENPSALINWRLSTRYDDGLVVWLNGDEIVHRNAPDPVAWDSIALEARLASDSVELEEWKLDSFVGALVSGTNVLAVQVLKSSLADHDLLAELRLEAFSSVETTNQPAYFISPTPGGENRYGSTALGPIVSSAAHSPLMPRDAEDLLVTARVTPTFGPVAAVTLRYRVMYSNEVAVVMLDDGLHGDGAAGDTVYGASIPAAAAAPGQMIRYALFASDAAQRTNRLPLFPNRVTTEEYYGTVVANPALSNALPVMHWFVKNVSGAEMDPGTLCSFFYDGEFYDNATVRLRGGTSRSWPKTSHKVELPDDHEFRIRKGVGRVTEFDWNTTYTDKSYVRAMLVSEHQLDSGLPSPEIFPVRLEQNGKFHSVTLFTEQPDKAFLRRHGLDELGSLYKGGPGANGDGVEAFEKKTRKTETNADLRALISGVGVSGAPLERYIFDGLDIPGMVNYMATAAIVQNIDGTDKNYFLYRDTEGTGEWRMLPWDMDLSFGPNALNTDTIVFDALYASHPLIGTRPYLLADGKYNRFIEAMGNTPRTRQMVMRRVRTLVERFLAKPYFQNRIDQLAVVLASDVLVDKAKWAGNAFFGGSTYTLDQALNRIKTEYLAPRLGYLTGPTIPGITTANPSRQSYAPRLQFGGMEINPPSGNQEEEYVQILNTGESAVDISGWKLRGDVEMEFKPGTVVPTNSSIYASPKSRVFRARASGPRGGQSLFVQDSYTGRLSARGGSLRLLTDLGREIAQTNYPGNPSLAQQHLRITELMYFPPSVPGDPVEADQFEFVELWNQSTTETVPLAGVRFTKGIQYSFTGALIQSLSPGQRLILTKNTSAFRARYGVGALVAGDYLGALENGQEGLRLEDASGEKIQEFSFDADSQPLTAGIGFSLVPVDETGRWDAASSASAWRTSSKWLGSPGERDGSPSIFPQVKVNEVRSSSPDAIELYHPGPGEALVEHWFLTDDFRQPKKFRIAAGTRIAAGGYLLYGEAAFGAGASGFRLQADGDEVWLFSANVTGELTGYVHGFRFGALEAGVTMGRVAGNAGQDFFLPQKQPTLGQPNVGAAEESLRITEICYHPRENQDDDQPLEFIELHNATANPLPLSNPSGASGGWQLSAGVEFRFATNVVVPAGGVLLAVSFDPVLDVQASTRFRAFYGLDSSVSLVGPWKGALNNAGDSVRLLRPIAAGPNPLWSVACDLNYSPASNPSADGDGASLHLRSLDAIPQDSTSWVAALPSPGRLYESGPAPVITRQPLSLRSIAFQPLELSVATSGDAPFAFQWRWNGARISGATLPSLSWVEPHPGQFGDYQVTAMNRFGSVISSNATVTLDLPPFLTQSPLSRTVQQGAFVVFSVSAQGSGPLSYQWRKGGQPIQGSTSPSYTLQRASVADAGDYDVLVTDDVGTMASPTAVLVVLIPPAILTQPDDTTVLAGQTLRLLSSATGTPPLTYRWRRGSIQVAAQTNALLQITNVTFSLAGNYNVVIANAAGAVTSRLAVVSILADVDRDGMADSWETVFGFNSTNPADATLDKDSDTVSNRDEYLAGTDPGDPSSYLHWEPVELTLASGQPAWVFSFQAASNRTYAVQSGLVGFASAWEDRWSFGARPTNSLISITNSGIDPSAQFYRIRTPRTP